MRYILSTVIGIGLLAVPAVLRAQTNPTPPAGKIEVLPFTALNPAEAQPWLGKSIQQSLLADLTVVAPARVLSSDVGAKDNAAAINAASKDGAQYVIVGSFATAGQDVRVTGTVLDVTSGKSVTAIKATGSTNNIFSLEDEVAALVRRRLQLNPVSAVPTSAPQQDVPPMAPLSVQPAPADAYMQAYATPPQPNQTEYNYYFSNPYGGSGGYGPYYYGGAPYWGYGWGGWGYGINTYGATVSSAAPTGVYFHGHTPSNAIWNGDFTSAGMANSINGVPMGPLNTASIGGQGFHNGVGLHASVTYHDSHTTVHAGIGGTRAIHPAGIAPANSAAGARH